MTTLAEARARAIARQRQVTAQQQPAPAPQPAQATQAAPNRYAQLRAAQIDKALQHPDAQAAGMTREEVAAGFPANGQIMDPDTGQMIGPDGQSQAPNANMTLSEGPTRGEQRMATVGPAVDKFIEGATFGLVGDELNAAGDALIRRGSKADGFSARYDENLENYRRLEANFDAQNPIAAPVIESGGALATAVATGGTSSLAGAGTGMAGRAAISAGTGAAAGGTYGFMEGEGDNRVTNAAISATFGGLFGAAAPKIGDALSGIPKRVSSLFSRSQERPTVGLLRETKNAAYRAVDQSGETFTGQEMTGLAQNVRKAFDDGNYVEEVDDAMRATLAILDRRAGQGTTLSQLDGVRQNLWSRYSRAGDQPQILDAIKAIDDLVESRAGASELMGVARAANSRYAKSQLLDDAFTKATDQTASTGSGGNILNKYRQAVTSIINNPSKARFFSDGELDMMRGFVRGNTSENMRRLVGKLSPNGNGLIGTLHVIAGVSTNGATLPIMAVGAAAKASADRSVQRGANQIQDVLAGAPMPQRPLLTAPVAGASIASAPALDAGRNALLGAR